MCYNKLTPEEERIIIHKGTELPFTGELLNNREKGTYLCKRCNAPLYRSQDKFDSGCGWPSFDDELPGAVHRQKDADGHRTEITCAGCGAHLGHVFADEGFTRKNTRHCVNSLSMTFVPVSDKTTGTAYFAGGCFWGTEYWFRKTADIVSVTVGYMGGKTDNPTYREVCSGTSGHYETCEIVFDKSKTVYETLVKLFFEIHDFTQTDGQGPDIGEQYLSVIFYTDDSQKQIAERCIRILTEKNYTVATKLLPATTFWKAEDYHQDYYRKQGTTPYCHKYQKKF
ncbi:MAG: bifunctional methionine sulfoxide reductase B/A protein [Prevotellaceae bacterium]|jgi:peptide methionine sulfoxide reductase msrA/msrB|nr:bifunctional methionine sulfoxide reductase B/A protein [Prevotellaceae bacterium]